MRSIKELEKLFTTRDWEKGRYLYLQGHIDSLNYDPEEKMLSGDVTSERGRGSYDAFIDWGLKKVICDCSCPVGRFCKHAAALVHAVLDNNNPMLDTPDQVVADWLESLKSSSPRPSSAKQDVPVYLLSPARVRDSSGIRVEVRLSRLLKSGNLSKSLRNTYVSEQLLRQVQEPDRQLLASLLAHRDPWGIVSELDALRPILASGRSYWQHLGDLPLSLAEPLAGQLKWVQQGNSHSLHPIVAGAPTGAVELVPTNPLCYLDDVHQQLVPLDFGLDAKQALALIDSPPMQEQQLAWAWPMMQQLLGEQTNKVPAPPVAQSLAIQPPVPHLLLKKLSRHPESCVARLSFDYQGQRISPYAADTLLYGPDGKAIPRDKQFEQQAIDKLRANGLTLAQANFNYWSAPQFDLKGDNQTWFALLHNLLPGLKQAGWVIEIEDGFPYQVAATEANIDTQIDYQEGDYFSLAMMIDVGGHKLPLFPILRSALQQLPKASLQDSSQDEHSHLFVELSDTQALPLPLSLIRPLLNQFVELFMPGNLNPDGSLKLSRFQSHQTLAMLDNHQAVGKGLDLLRQTAEKLRHFDGIKQVEVPDALQAQLRPYQHQGLNWMQFLREYGLAGILADDMGLGKTLQSIANLCVEKQAGRLTQPALILAPTSVIFNWQAELCRFAPHLHIILLYGPNRHQHLAEIAAADVVITSYPLVQRDSQILAEQHWHYLVMDEAQTLKNPGTKLYEAVSGLKASHKLCLTGTPMENHLGELWAQFNLLLPGLLGSHSHFSKLFRTPIEKQQDGARRQLLSERIRPFVLRRSKDKIAQELPAKTEIISKVRIEGKQAELYESVRLTVDDTLREVIANKGLARSQIEILDAMLKLRQVCCHPQLLSLASAQKVKQSAKLELLMEMLPELVSEGRRILLFSQFTSMLEIIEQQLQKQGIGYVKLTGATRQRQQVIDQFKQGDAPLFLISLKAGGTGLNLTEADTVIHYDPWWNPAVENQATDRVHRIGQDKPVFVYKLIVEGSIEERIQSLQEQKSRLAKAILADELADNSSGLNAESLQALLQPLQSVS